MGEERKHSISGPSKLWLRMICQGSGEMARAARDAGIVQPTSPAAERGNRLHLAVETGNVADLDDEDAEWVRSATAMVAEVTKGLPLIEKEQTFAFLPNMGFGKDTEFGTPDSVYGNRFGHIRVIDLKSGRKQVDSRTAPQLHVIAGVKMVSLPAVSADVCIIQPPYVPVIAPFNPEIYKAAIDASVRSSGEAQDFRVGSHCGMCDGAVMCPFARWATCRGVGDEPSLSASSEDLAELLDRGAILDQVVSQAKATMKARLDPLPQGSEIRGWTLSRPRNIKKWIDEAAARAVVEKTAPELIEHKMPSPAKALNALGAVVKDLIGTVPGARCLSKKEDEDHDVLSAGTPAGAGAAGGEPGRIP